MERIHITSESDISNFDRDFILGNKRGIIQLAVPVLNICEWSEAEPSYYPALLGLTNKEFSSIVYYGSMVVRSSKLDAYPEGAVLNPDAFTDFEALPSEEKNKVELISGAEAIRFLLDRAARKDLPGMWEAARKEEMSCMSRLETLGDEFDSIEDKELIHRLFNKMAETPGEELDLSEEECRVFDLNEKINDQNVKLAKARATLDAIYRLKNGGREKLFIDEIILFPVEMKGILKTHLSSGLYTTEDLHEFYRRIINRNRRVHKLRDLGAPPIIMRNESRLLQEFVDTLIGNGRQGRAINRYTNDSDVPMASLTDIILRNTKMV